MKWIFDWLREQMQERIKLYQTLDMTETAVDVAIKETERFIEYINEAEAKWESEFCEWKFEKNTGLVWHCENKVESCNIPYQRELKTFLEEFECKCPHCGKPIQISEVE